MTHHEENEGEYQDSFDEELDLLKQTIDAFDAMPPHAMSYPVSNYDLQSVLILIYALLKKYRI